MEKKKISIDFPADYNFVPGVRNCVARTSSNFGFSNREAYQIETIVDEICNNAIEYGSKSKDDLIKIECVFDKDKVQIVVKDSGGKKFKVDEVFIRNTQLMEEELSNPELLARRGRGLIIVKKLVDKLDIKVSKEGTTVRIIKQKGSDI